MSNFRKNSRHKSYRLTVLKGGKWKRGADCGGYEEAEFAARDLITGRMATRVHIVEISKDGERTVAEVGPVKKLGWPQIKAEVRKF